MVSSDSVKQAAVHYFPGYNVRSKKGFNTITKHITDSSHKEVTASSDFWISLPVLNTGTQQELIKHHKIRLLVETVVIKHKCSRN